MTVFDQAFATIVGTEGGYTEDRRDPGNWTGGAVGRGFCHGTNWGISAASFPTLAIRSLTQAQAAEIYRARYWAPIGGDTLPPPLALLVFDAAVNNGPGRAQGWLHQARATPHATPAALCAAYLALRLDYMARLPGWPIFGAGWSRRLAALPYQSMEMKDG